MKLSEAIRQLESVLKEHGDLSLLSSIDPEGNGYNLVRGTDLVYFDGDEYIFDSLDEIEENDCDCDDFEQYVLMYV